LLDDMLLSRAGDERNVAKGESAKLVGRQDLTSGSLAALNRYFRALLSYIRVVGSPHQLHKALLQLILPTPLRRQARLRKSSQFRCSSPNRSIEHREHCQAHRIMYRAYLQQSIVTESQTLRRSCPPSATSSNPASLYFCPPPPPAAPADAPPSPARSRPEGSPRPCLGWVTSVGSWVLDPAARPPSSLV
jgi:hypothetical protein